jgi:hypothetical protein
MVKKVDSKDHSHVISNAGSAKKGSGVTKHGKMGHRVVVHLPSTHALNLRNRISTKNKTQRDLRQSKISQGG